MHKARKAPAAPGAIIESMATSFTKVVYCPSCGRKNKASEVMCGYCRHWLGGANLTVVEEGAPLKPPPPEVEPLPVEASEVRPQGTGIGTIIILVLAPFVLTGLYSPYISGGPFSADWFLFLFAAAVLSFLTWYFHKFFMGKWTRPDMTEPARRALSAGAWIAAFFLANIALWYFGRMAAGVFLLFFFRGS